MALRAGRLGRLRRGFARAGVARTGVAGHDLRCRPRRGVRPRGNDLLDSAAAGAAGEQRCDDDYRDDRHPMPPRAATIQAFQWGQIRTAARLAALPAECAATLTGNPAGYIRVNTQGCSCRDANVAVDDASSATAESGGTAA